MPEPARQASFLRLLAPAAAGGAVLAIVVWLLAGGAYAGVLIAVVAIVSTAVVVVRLRGRGHGPDGSRSSDDGHSPHQGFDGSPLGDTDQLSRASTTGSVARDRAESRRR